MKLRYPCFPRQFELVVIVLLLVVTLTTIPKADAAGPDTSKANSANNEPIKIGFVVSVTSIGAGPSAEMIKGVQFLLDSCNNKFAGRDVKLLVEDNESSPSKAVVKATKLVKQDHIDFMLCDHFSPSAAALVPVAGELKVPLVVGASGANNMTQRNRNDYIIRTGYTASQVSYPLGVYAAKHVGGKNKKIITVASDFTFGYESVGAFQTTFEQNGGKVIQKLWIPLDGKDFSVALKKMHKDADAVYMCIAGQSSYTLPLQYQEFGPKLPIFGSMTSFAEQVLPKAGEALLGGISSSVYSTVLDTPANRRFVKNFQAKYGYKPGWYVESGYTSALAIKKAVETLHGDISDKDKLLSALHKLQLTDDPRGPLQLDDYGNPVESVYIRQLRKVDGELQNAVIQTFPKVSQFWTWKPDEYMAGPSYSRSYPPCKNCED